MQNHSHKFISLLFSSPCFFLSLHSVFLRRETVLSYPARGMGSTTNILSKIRAKLRLQNCISLLARKRSVFHSNKKLSYSRDSAVRRSLRRSRSFKVTDFGTNRKPVCDFLLVNNNNLHSIAPFTRYR